MNNTFVPVIGMVWLAGCAAGSPGGAERQPSTGGGVDTHGISRGAAPTVSTANAADVPPTSVFDRAAAARAIAAVDVSRCYDKPPMLEGNLHVTLTFMPDGRVSEASADAPYAGTEAGECAAALFRAVRVPAYNGPPKQMGRTVPHAPIKGNASDPPFDPSAVRAAAAAQDFSECADLPSGGVERGRATIAVQPSGEVKSVFIDAPLGGTPRGQCIVRLLQSLMLGPYSGEPAPGVVVDVESRARPAPAPAPPPRERTRGGPRRR